MPPQSSRRLRPALIAVLLVLTSSCVQRGPERRLARNEARLDSMAVTLAAVTRRLSDGGSPRPDTVTVVVGGDLILGRRDAPVTIVEFTDFQCPFCARHATTTLPELRRRYIATGQVRYIVRELPLSAIHPLAREAALLGRCVAELGADPFWAYHDHLFAHQRGMTRDTILRAATTAGLSHERARECLTTNRFDAALEADRRTAERAGFRGTPAFVVGLTTASDTVRGAAISGAYPIAEFEAAIRGAAPNASHAAAP